MPVAKPGKRLLHGIPLKFVQKRVAGGGHKGVNAELNLTSMIDYLVITVVFLLSQFGTQQQVQSSAGLEIPETHNADALQSASGALRVPIAIAFMLEGAILLAALGGEVFRRNRLVVRRIAEATA